MGGCVSRDTMGGCVSRDGVGGCVCRDDACCSARERGPLSPRPMPARRNERLPTSLRSCGSPERYDLGTPEDCAAPELEERTWYDDGPGAPDGCTQEAQHFLLTHSARPYYVESSRTAVARVPRLNLSSLPEPCSPWLRQASATSGEGLSLRTLSETKLDSASEACSPANCDRCHATSWEGLSLRTLSETKGDSASEAADSERDSHAKLKELELLIQELEWVLDEPDVQVAPQAGEAFSANEVVQQSARLLKAQRLISTLPTRLAHVPRPLSSLAFEQQLDTCSEAASAHTFVQKCEDPSVTDAMKKSDNADVGLLTADASCNNRVIPDLQDLEPSTNPDVCLERGSARRLETSAADWLESGLGALLEQERSDSAGSCSNRACAPRKRRTSKIGSDR